MISVMRRVQPVVCAVLGLAAVQCGGGSTPESNTPASSPPPQAARTDEDQSGIIESGRTYEQTEPGAEASQDSERVPVAGTDEPGEDIGSNVPPETESYLAPALSDAQIAAITDLVNSTEIEQAELALGTSNDPRVLSFARMMLEQHREWRQRQAQLGFSTAGSPMFQTISQQGRRTVATLSDLEGQEFDRAYLQAQLEQHQRVLNQIDQQLLPTARNPQLVEYLQTMRPIVQQHLQAARALQMP
jgi:putative membrane protein